MKHIGLKETEVLNILNKKNSRWASTAGKQQQLERQQQEEPQQEQRRQEHSRYICNITTSSSR